MKKILLFTGGFAIGIVCVFLIFYINSQLIFDTKQPSFNKRETEFINKNICTIMGKIKNSENYYIHDVKKKHDSIVVVLYPLNMLQSGIYDKRFYPRSIHVNGSIRLMFSKTGEFISVLGEP